MSTACTGSVPERFTGMGTPWAESWGEDWGRVVQGEEAKRGQRICGARMVSGRPCTAESTHTSGRCRHHGGFAGSGAPTGNRNAQRHGLFARSIQRCGPHCPLWKHCPMAGPDIEAMAEADRPECPYEVAQYESGVRDGLERFGMVAHPAPESLSANDSVRPQEVPGEGLRRNMVCTIAILQVMMVRATSSLSVRPLVRGLGKRSDRVRIDPALEAFQRVSAEQRRYLGYIRDPSGLTKWDERYPEETRWRPEWQVKWEEAARAAGAEKNHGDHRERSGEGIGEILTTENTARHSRNPIDRELTTEATEARRPDTTDLNRREHEGIDYEYDYEHEHERKKLTSAQEDKKLADSSAEDTEQSGDGQEQGKHGEGNGEIRITENTESRSLGNADLNCTEENEGNEGEHGSERELGLAGEDGLETESFAVDDEELPVEWQIPPGDPAYEEIPPGATGYHEGVIQFRVRELALPTDNPLWPKDPEEERHWRDLRRRVRKAREAVAMAEGVIQESRVSVPSRMLLEQRDRAREVLEKLELEAVGAGIPLPVRHHPIRLGWNPDG